jgi:hypothetical protein
MLFRSNCGSWVQSGLERFVREILYLRANRDLLYTRLDSISRDPPREQISMNRAAALQNDDLKNWFVNRFVFSAQPATLTNTQLANYKMAIDCMSLLDPTVRFSTVDASTFNIMLETRDGIVPMEFLSSGYRAIFYTVLGVIKEVELRKVSVLAKDFAGVIMIDEIDLHLHPTWQREIARVLTETFSSAQFIVTTHSPHVIQSVDSGQVIALVRDEEGRPCLNRLPEMPYGFQGWTVEEILEDVMKVPTTKSTLFENMMHAFDQALSEESPQKLAKCLDALQQMLHPKSPLRKLLRIQAAPVLG